MIAVLNKEFRVPFTIANPEDQFGQAIDANAMPIATVYKNTAATVVDSTVTKVAGETGEYFVTLTVADTDFAAFDTLSIKVVALLGADPGKPVKLFISSQLVIPEHLLSLYVDPLEGTVRAEVEGMAGAIELATLDDKVSGIVAGTSVLRADNRDGAAIATQASVTAAAVDLTKLRRLLSNNVIIHPTDLGYLQILDDDGVTPYAKIIITGTGVREVTIL